MTISFNKGFIYLLFAFIFGVSAFNTAYFLLLIPVLIVVYTVKILKIGSVQLYLSLYFYVAITLIFSVFSHQMNIVIMDAKIVTTMAFFYFFYMLSYRRFITLDDFYRPILFAIQLIAIISVINYSFGERYINRGDLGNTLILFFPLLVHYYSRNYISNFRMLVLSLYILTILVFLGGRTALIAYIFSLFLFVIYRRSIGISLSKKILSFIVLIFLVSMYFLTERILSGSSALTGDARVFALLIFENILIEGPALNLLFGFGFGEVYDSFVELTTQVGVQHHYDQIKYSSGVGHYVSWGFHNNIVRMFLFFGLAGFLLLFAWQVSLFYAGKNKTPIHIFQLKTVLKVIFILALLLSFSNGIYSTTLTACFLFSIQGLLYGEIRYLTKMSLVQ